MENIDIERAIASSWARLKANPAFYVLGLLVAFLFTGAISSIVLGPLYFASWGLRLFGIHWLDFAVVCAAFALKCLVLTPLLVGYLRGVRREAAGETASIADLFSGFKNYSSIVVFSAVMGALLAIGFAFFVVPGLLLCPIASMSLYYVAEGFTGAFGIDAIVKAFKSWSIKLELVILVVMAASLLSGLLLCCVGTIVTVPLGIATVWRLCRQFSDGQLPLPPEGSGDDQIGTPS